MQKSHFRSLLLLLFLNLLIKPLWLLGIDRTVQNTVGMQVYGLYYALFTFSMWMQLILDPGIHTFNNREIAQDNTTISGYFSAFLPLKFILAIFYFIITIIAGLIIGFRAHEVYLLAWIAVIQVLSSLLLYLRSNLAGLHLFKTDSIFSVLDRTLMIILCGILLQKSIIGSPFKIEWFIYAQVVALGLSCVAAFIVVLSKSKFFKPTLKWAFFYSVIKKSYPFAILTILMTLYSRIDATMLERILPEHEGNYQSGVYAQAYRILDAMNNIAFLFATILLPVFAGMIKRREPISDITNISFKMLIIPALVIVVACFTFRMDIMHVLYKDSTEYSSTVFGYLIFTFLAICLVYIYGTMLTAGGNLKFLNWISASGLAVNIILNFFLIPQYKAIGAVCATLSTQAFVSVAQLIYARRQYKIKAQRYDILKFAAFAIFIFTSFYLGSSLKVKWVYEFIALTGINLTFAFLIGLLKINFFIGLLKRDDI